MPKKEIKSKQKSKGGRPPWKPTHEEIAKVEKLSTLGLTNDQIAYFFDKNRDTIYQRMNDTAEFSDAIKRGKAKAAGKVLGALWKKIEGGDTACILFYLKTQMDWKETRVVENVGNNGDPIQHEFKLSEPETESKKRLQEIIGQSN